MVVGDFGSEFIILIFQSLDCSRDWLKGQYSVLLSENMCIFGEVKSGICSHSPSPSKKCGFSVDLPVSLCLLGIDEIWMAVGFSVTQNVYHFWHFRKCLLP
jgi:hypothetical protein